jgi:hypothetical protein
LGDDDRSTPTIDAVRFVTLTQGLRAAFSRVGDAQLTARQRLRWQQRLLSITDAAHGDLAAAQTQLDRYDEDWRREVG